MATQIISRKNKDGSMGHKIRVTFGNGMQKFLSLGSKYSPAKVGEIKLFVDKVVIARDTGERLDKVTQTWLDDMKDDLRGRFIKAELIELPKTITVGKLFDRFIRESVNREDRKENTIQTYETASKRFFSYFGREKMTDDVTKDECLQWRKWMTTDDAYKGGYAEASIATCIIRCNTVFNWAIEQGFIELNPFKGVKRGSFVNKDRDYVPMTDYYRILDACPDQEWRTLIALWRIGGLRGHCEPKELRWCDVNWEMPTPTMLVTSPKTAHHSGKGTRIVPLFPELRAELEKQFEQAEPGGSPFVIPRLRDKTNNGVQFSRIVFNAGLDGWEKILQNLRASRATDIAGECGLFLESVWIGHKTKVAIDHYLQVTPADIQRAIQPKEKAVPYDPAGIMALN